MLTFNNFSDPVSVKVIPGSQCHVVGLIEGDMPDIELAKLDAQGTAYVVFPTRAIRASWYGLSPITVSMAQEAAAFYFHILPDQAGDLLN